MDRRIKKTKKAIKLAFTNLLKIKGINNITVTDIVNSADISRKTFYYHYAGIWDIVEEVEENLLTQLDEEYKNVCLETNLSPYSVFDRIIKNNI